MIWAWIWIVIIGFIVLSSIIKIIAEWERAVVLVLGRYWRTMGPGLILIIPGVMRIIRVSLRVVTLDVPPQDVITKDNVSIKVNAVVYFRVMDPATAVLRVEDYMYATSQLSQTTLRSILGESELDDILTQRENINRKLQEILDKQTDPWGIKVTLVEVKHIDLPAEMQRAMARQAEEERVRRAKIIHADGEHQAAEKLSLAAKVISEHPEALQLRYLQTLTEIATEKNSTVLFPIPIDLLTPFLKQKE